MDRAIERAKTGENRENKILQHSLTAYIMEAGMERRLAALGETDMIHFTTSYGKIFACSFVSVCQCNMNLIQSPVSLD